MSARHRRAARRTGRALPRVSILVTARDPQELKAKVQELRRQQYPTFEIVATLGGSIAQGYNRAIRRAKGAIVVFTETDTVPMTRTWLRDLVAQVRPGEVVKGLDVQPSAFNLSNTACFADIARHFPFDERYPVAEDTEWAERLAQHGIPIRRIHTTGVWHLRHPHSRKALRRAYQYGRAWARLHRESGFEELPSLIEQSRLQMARGRAVLRGIQDELRRRSRAGRTRSTG